VAFRFTPRTISNPDGIGNLHINGLTVNGSVTAIPEPSSLAMCVVGMVGCALRRRQRRN